MHKNQYLISMSSCRLRAAGKANVDGVKKSRPRERRGIPVPEANAELQANIDVCLIRLISLQLVFLIALLEL